MVDIAYLADQASLLPELTRWFEAEWVPYYGPGGPGDAAADLRESMNRDVLPICLVAIDQGRALGTISLKDTSISHPELGPWGAALLVSPKRRGEGVGTTLVKALENEARRLGFERLYMSTDAANGILEARGWRAIDTADSLRGPITVYELDLSIDL